jgi:hypothetical protein
VRPFGRRLSNTVAGGSSAGDDAEIDDDDAVRRCGWPDAQLAESPRGLAAIWAACGLEMDDELTGGPSAAREEAECMSEMAPDDAHDELMCSMDVVAEVHAQDAEREQQREGASVGCVMPNGDGAGGDDCEAGRALEGDDGGYMGCEGGRAPTASSRGRRWLRARQRTATRTRSWRAKRTSRCSTRRGAAVQRVAPSLFRFLRSLSVH